MEITHYSIYGIKISQRYLIHKYLYLWNDWKISETSLTVNIYLLKYNNNTFYIANINVYSNSYMVVSALCELISSSFTTL